MEIVKVVNEGYHYQRDLRNLIFYVTDAKKTGGMFFGIGVNPYHPQMMFDQMIAVKKAYGKEADGLRQVRHIIVGFQDQKVTSDLAFRVGYDIAGFYAGRYQVIYGIHQNTDNLHIHFLINSVSYMDGRMFSGGWTELADFKYHVRNVLIKYGIVEMMLDDL